MNVAAEWGTRGGVGARGMGRMILSAGWRLLIAVFATLVLVPAAVLLLVNWGLAGSYLWLPVCLGGVAVLAGLGAFALWRRYPKMRVASGGAALVWSALVLSVAYWPVIVTRAEVNAAFGHIRYDGDPAVWRLGQPWCLQGDSGLPGCPRLHAHYFVRDGEGQKVLRAVEDAGFRLISTPPQQPQEVKHGSPGQTVGLAWLYEYEGHGMRLEATLETDRESASPVANVPGATEYRPLGGETVTIHIFDPRTPDHRR
jgi:hypothetical protein